MSGQQGDAQRQFELIDAAAQSIDGYFQMFRSGPETAHANNRQRYADRLPIRNDAARPLQRMFRIRNTAFLCALHTKSPSLDKFLSRLNERGVKNMTGHPLQLIRGDRTTTQEKPRHPLENLDSTLVSKHLVLFRPSEEVLRTAMDKSRKSIRGLTDVEAVPPVI